MLVEEIDGSLINILLSFLLSIGLDSNRLSLLPKRAGGESPVHTL